MNSFALITVLAFAPPPEDASSVSASDSASASESASETATETATADESVSETATTGETSSAASAPASKTVEVVESRESSSSANNAETITVTGPATAAPPPDPQAPPPTPGPPPGGAEAVGGTETAPLPPPPTPVNPSRIQQGPWRGKAWIGVKVTVTGPLGTGPGPYANPTVLSWGGLLEGGWRINNLFAVGASISRHPHQQRKTVVRDPFDELEYTTVYTGRLLPVDVFARAYAPVFGRFQPYIDVGGGIALITPPLPQDANRAAGVARGSVGLDIWLARNFTINASVLYRFIGAGGADIGHSLSGHAGVGIHF